jgi:Ca-activated chloride channel homolog
MRLGLLDVFILMLGLSLFSALSVKPGEQKTARSEPGQRAQPVQHREQKPDDKIRLSTRLVSMIVTVSDPYGRFVTGLSKEQFEVYDETVKQEIAIFSDEDAPLTLGIIYDVSGSMSDLTQRSFAALKKFFDTSHDDDEYFVVAFNDKPKLVQDFTASPNEILNKTVFIKAKGSTALYDATYLAVEKVKQGRHPKKALLILSDGLDNNSRYSGKELRSLLKEADVQIYSIGWTELLGGSGILKQLSEWSGGRAFFPYDDRMVGDIYTRIAVMLRHQYVLGFYPSDLSATNKWRNVRLKVNAPKGLGRLSLSYKKGYQSFALQ